jgi:hypothetical protein
MGDWCGLQDKRDTTEMNDWCGLQDKRDTTEMKTRVRRHQSV